MAAVSILDHSPEITIVIQCGVVNVINRMTYRIQRRSGETGEKSVTGGRNQSQGALVRGDA